MTEQTIGGSLTAQVIEQAAAVPWVRIAILVAGAAFICWYSVKAIEDAAKKRYPASRVASGGPDPLWWLPLLTLLSILLGCVMGFLVMDGEWDTTYGILIGGGTGAAPAWIIKLVQKRATKAADG